MEVSKSSVFEDLLALADFPKGRREGIIFIHFGLGEEGPLSWTSGIFSLGLLSSDAASEGKRDRKMFS